MNAQTHHRVSRLRMVPPTNILPPAARPDEPQMPDIGCKQPGNRTARRNTK